MKKSFTMIEIIFVIVVLAIIAGGTFEFILRIYQTYAKAKTVDTLQTELDLAFTQISNRLAYRIKDSVIASDGISQFHDLNATPKVYNSLEWIGYDREGLMGMWNGSSAIIPGWSGFIDRNLMTDTTITSLGSNLNFANQIINSLSNGVANLTNSRVALIIPGNDENMRYGWYNQEGNNSFIVNCNTPSCSSGDNIFRLSNDPDYTIPTGGSNDFKFTDRNDTDRYYLSWSAYALVLNSSNELKLYYNYQPWATTRNTYNDGDSSTLLKNVNSFEFWQNGNVVWIRICMESGEDDTLSLEDSNTYGFCKERAIY